MSLLKVSTPADMQKIAEPYFEAECNKLIAAIKPTIEAAKC